VSEQERPARTGGEPRRRSEDLDSFANARATFRGLFGYELHATQGTRRGDAIEPGDGNPGDDRADHLTVSYPSRHGDAAAVRTELLDIACTLIAHGEDVRVSRHHVHWHGSDGVVLELLPSWEDRATTSDAGGPEAGGSDARVSSPTFDDLDLARVHWTRFYGEDRGVPEPSPFATWVAGQLSDSLRTVIELGCGNGRDTAAVAQGRGALGLDYSPTAIEHNRAVWAATGLEFEQVDVGDAASLAAATAGRFDDGPVAVYSRFFIHAISDDAEAVLLRFLRRSLPSGSVVYLEFRTEKDKNTPKVFGEHYRRFVDPGALIRRMRRGGHFTVLHDERGHGLAVYKDEDPYVARLVLQKRSPWTARVVRSRRRDTA